MKILLDHGGDLEVLADERGARLIASQGNGEGPRALVVLVLKRHELRELARLVGPLSHGPQTITPMDAEGCAALEAAAAREEATTKR